MTKNRVMTHLVAGYPTMDKSEEAALAMVRGGASFLEIQFPFSDPVADGPLIQAACSKAIENGFNLDNGFSMVKKLTGEIDIPVFIMTYANIAVAAGIDNFVKRSKAAGAAGLIIPDLPFDYDEGLFSAGEKYGISVVPVMVPSISDFRLKKIISMEPDFIYSAIRKGITGSTSSIDHNTISFLDKISSKGIRILGGFGIREKKQIQLLSTHIYCAVVGSALVEVIKSGGDVEGFVHTLTEV